MRPKITHETMLGTPELTGLLPDYLIRQHIKIDPLQEQSPPGQISSGIGSYGYDARLGYKFKLFDPVSCLVMDPKRTDPKAFREVDLSPHKGEHEPNRYAPDYCKWCGLKLQRAMLNECPKRPPSPDHLLLPPNSYCLGETLEWFEIPRDILVVCLGKSTYARVGVIANITPLEPEWRGKITLEFSNAGPLPVKMYPGEGCIQLLFFRTLADCAVSYNDKKGAYQDQKELTLAKVRQE